MNAYTVAAAAASVAVKIPAKIPPKMITGVIMGMTLSRKEISTSRRFGLVDVALGRMPRED
jgi:hypothetical protein